MSVALDLLLILDTLRKSDPKMIRIRHAPGNYHAQALSLTRPPTLPLHFGNFNSTDFKTASSAQNYRD